MTRLFSAALAALSSLLFTLPALACTIDITQASSRTVRIMAYDHKNRIQNGTGYLVTPTLVLTVRHVQENEGVVFKQTETEREIFKAVGFKVISAAGHIAQAPLSNRHHIPHDLMLLQLPRALSGPLEKPMLAPMPAEGDLYYMWSIQQNNVPRIGKVIGPNPGLYRQHQIQLELGGVKGDSGTPLFDCESRLIGIIQAIDTTVSVPGVDFTTLVAKYQKMPEGDEKIAKMKAEHFISLASHPRLLADFLCRQIPNLVVGCPLSASIR